MDSSWALICLLAPKWQPLSRPNSVKYHLDLSRKIFNHFFFLSIIIKLTFNAEPLIVGQQTTDVTGNCNSAREKKLLYDFILWKNIFYISLRTFPTSCSMLGGVCDQKNINNVNNQQNKKNINFTINQLDCLFSLPAAATATVQ